MDALDEKVRALEVERLRPDAKPRTTEELLGDLIAALRSLYRTPPDSERYPQPCPLPVDERSGVAPADADHGLLGEPVVDQPSDLRWSHSIGVGAADRLAQLGPRSFLSLGCLAVEAPVAFEVCAHVVHEGDVLTPDVGMHGQDP